MRLFFILFIVIGFINSSLAAAAVEEPFIVNTLNADQDGRVSWNVDKTNWLSQAWVWSKNHQASLWDGYDQYFHPIIDCAEGGIVFKFQTSDSKPFNIDISALYGMSSYAGQKVTLYYSDENDWAALSPMNGSLWPGNTEFDTNPNWQMLETYQTWNPIGFNDTLDGRIYSSDGVFYVRVDLTTVSAVPTWVRLFDVSITGQSVQEHIFFHDRTCFGVCCHTGSNWDQMADIGSEWVRLGFDWNTLETSPGVFNTAAIDAQVQGYLSHGQRCLGILCYTNSNYPDPAADFAAFKTAFCNYAEEMARRFAKYDVVWEIWNEPQVFPHGAMNDPLKYAELARAVAARIKTASPNALVAACSLAWYDEPYLQSALTQGQLLKDGTIDLISLHFYHRPGTFGGYMQPSGIMAESNLKENIQRTRDLVEQARVSQRFTQPVGIIGSETGYGRLSSGTPKGKNEWRMYCYTRTEQAAYLARHHLTCIAAGLELSIWYKDMWGEGSFSLYENGIPDSILNLEPMGVAYRNLSMIFDQHTSTLANRKNPCSFLPQDVPASLVHIESFIKDVDTADETIIAAGWYGVEVFEGKVLTQRVQQDDNVIETWRQIEPQDKTFAAGELVISNISWPRVEVKMLNLLQPAAWESYNDYVLTGSELRIKNLQLEPMPVILLISKFNDPQNCDEVQIRGYKLKGDINGDCEVDLDDFYSFISEWLKNTDPSGN